MNNIHTAEKIHMEIFPKIQNGSSHLDSIVEYCEKYGLEVEVIAKILKKSPILKEELKKEAVKMNLLKDEKNDQRLPEW